MSLLMSAAQSGTADLTAQVRERIAAGAPVAEVEYADLPMWFFAEVDLDRPVAAVFRSDTAVLAVYADGGRLLRGVPAAYRA